MSRKKTPKKRRVKPLIVLGHTYPMTVARTPEELADLSEHNEGSCLFDSFGRRMLINGALAEPALPSVARHEGAHAVLFETGLYQLLPKALGLTEEQSTVLQEFICDTFVPVYLDSLERSRWIKFLPLLEEDPNG